MSLVGNSKSRAFHQHVRKGAVPLGQHSHHPDQIMPLPPAPVTEAAVAPTYPDLARPADRRLGCVLCPASAALLDPATGRAYCAEHWISGVVQRSLD